MKKLFILTFLGISSYCFAQNSDFAKELTEFRTNIYPLLNNYDSDKLLKYDFDETDLISTKIDSFVHANEHKIQKYQLQLLEQYSNDYNFTIKTDGFEQIDVSDFNQKLNEIDVGLSNPIYKLLLINPIKELEIYRNMYLMQKYTNTEFAVFSTKLTIVPSLIKTKKLKNGQWEIIENMHEFLIKANYDPKKGRITKIECYQRKLNNN
ncbi:hypothetical protein OO013_07710 [Mangrovivirga sp. M17]|uniref:Uncharacterized protein n=1 Tax=Mangrovivirga halotolerans TaxID=2993936 RepID=A0ABT3RQ59_9BACT|nr:hypothetical protein [Mangrovivirga halotolerans]MCX2743745.1 hypothetical protein [Mangrovivirga halotolerans]